MFEKCRSIDSSPSVSRLYRSAVVAPLIALLASAATPAGADPLIYATINNKGVFSVIDEADDMILDRVTVAPSPADAVISPDGASLYIVQPITGDVNVVDTSDNSVTTISTGFQLGGLDILPDGSLVFVANSSDGSVSVIDTATGTLVDTDDGDMDVTPIDIEATPRQIAASPSGDAIWVTTTAPASIVIIDPTTFAVLDDIESTSELAGLAFSPLGDEAYVVKTDGELSVVDVATKTFGTDVMVGTGPRRVVVTPDGATAVVTNLISSTVSVVDLSTLMVVGSVGTATSPTGLDLTADGATAIVSGFGSLTRVDVASATGDGSITLESATDLAWAVVLGPEATPTPTATATASVTSTATPSPTPSATAIPPSATPTSTAIPSTPTATATNTPATPTATATSTAGTPTATATNTATAATPTSTATNTATAATPTATATSTTTAGTPTATATNTTTAGTPTATATMNRQITAAQSAGLDRL